MNVVGDVTVGGNGDVWNWQGGFYYQTSPTQWTASDSGYIGRLNTSGTATLIVDNNGTEKSVTSASVTVGAGSGTTGALIVSGSGASYSAVDGWMVISDGGSGTLTVQNGAIVSSSSSTAIGYNNTGIATIDNGTLNVGGYLFLNRYNNSDNSVLNIQNGGSVTTDGDLSIWYNTATVNIEGGYLAAASVNTPNYDDPDSSVTINIGESGMFALGNVGAETMSAFTSRFVGTGNVTLNIWHDGDYVNYTSLTEGVDYAVTYGTGDLAGYGVVSPIPEPAAFGLFIIVSAVGLFIRRRISYFA